MERQLNAAIQALPEEIRALFDPGRPLTSDVIFQPRLTTIAAFRSNLLSAGLFSGGITGCFPLCMLIALIGSVLDGTQAIGDVGGLFAVGLIFIVLSGVVLLSWLAFGWPLWTEWRTMREQRAGTMRRGLFLTTEAFIVRTESRRCDIIPRDAIVSIYYAAEQTSECWRIVYQVQDHKTVGYDLDFPPFETRKPDPNDVLLIRRWAGIGNAEFVESGYM